jgi:hypothetical protein
LHHWPTFQILGVQFGVSESTANYLYISPQAKNLIELLPASLLE